MGERIRIGIVGLRFGKAIVKDIASGPGAEHFELAAVCDLDRPRAETLAREYGVASHLSLESLLADPTIPAVGLFTGPVGRASLIRQIIHSGRDVMTTKPFEGDPVAAAQILDEARTLGRVVHLNSPSPATSEDLLQIERWRDELDLGRPVAARAEILTSYRESTDGSWYDSPQACPVAPIYRLGIYLINDLVQLFGEAEAVSVMHSRLFTGRPTPDNAQLSIRFRNGAVGNVFASFCVADGERYRNSLSLNYERGSVYRNAGPAHGTPGGGMANLAVVTADTDGKPVTQRAQFASHSGTYRWQAFYDAITRRDAHVSTPVNQVVAGLRIIEAMARAEHSGRIETVAD